MQAISSLQWDVWNEFCLLHTPPFSLNDDTWKYAILFPWLTSATFCVECWSPCSLFIHIKSVAPHRREIQLSTMSCYVRLTSFFVCLLPSAADWWSSLELVPCGVMYCCRTIVAFFVPFSSCQDLAFGISLAQGVSIVPRWPLQFSQTQLCICCLHLTRKKSFIVSTQDLTGPFVSSGFEHYIVLGELLYLQ